MAIIARREALSTTAQIIATGSPTMSDKTTVILKTPSALIYLGGSDVDATVGMPFDVDDAIAIDLGPGDVLYARATAGTPTVQVLLTRQ